MKEKSERRNCVKCGRNLKENQKLWCGECIKLVDAELRGETNKPYQYFFKRNLKHKK